MRNDDCNFSPLVLISSDQLFHWNEKLRQKLLQKLLQTSYFRTHLNVHCVCEFNPYLIYSLQIPFLRQYLSSTFPLWVYFVLQSPLLKLKQAGVEELLSIDLYWSAQKLSNHVGCEVRREAHTIQKSGCFSHTRIERIGCEERAPFFKVLVHLSVCLKLVLVRREKWEWYWLPYQ